jgi:hypothetical protein
MAEYHVANPSSNTRIIGQNDSCIVTLSHSRTSYRLTVRNVAWQMARSALTYKNSTKKYLEVLLKMVQMECLSEPPISRYDHAI